MDCDEPSMVRLIYLQTFVLVNVSPDTGDLVCRFGIHSGAVTAGVLRGEKSRFQLFGDTVRISVSKAIPSLLSLTRSFCLSVRLISG